MGCNSLRYSEYQTLESELIAELNSQYEAKLKDYYILIP